MTNKNAHKSAEQSQNKSDGIDYNLEGNDPGDRKESSTDAGYDEAAHSGLSRYGVAEGAGGVFGTTGGGSFGGGFQVVERPVTGPATTAGEGDNGRKGTARGGDE